MKISAEGFNYDKKGNIERLRCNVLLKFGYNKKTKSIFNIEICLKMKYGNIPPSAITGLSTIYVLI
jgi:hypothetical protein